MNSQKIMVDWDVGKAARAQQLCEAFLTAPSSKRFIFGRNVYAAAVVSRLDVAAIVDDFTEEPQFSGVPIVRGSDIPADAIVLAASGGRPLTARLMLESRGVKQLDYFSLLKWSGLDLPEAVFNEGFRTEVESNPGRVDWLFQILADEESRESLRRVLSFRWSYDLDCLNGFEDREKFQYFEPFLDLGHGAHVFVDVGGFDGFTSEEFIKKSPDYKAVYVFEPETGNRAKCEERLSKYPGVTVLPFGAADRNTTLRFATDGSASSIRADGGTEITVRRIDDVVHDAPTFIKMDIEGAELSAIEGARRTIVEYKPALALCVYHRPTDFWEIPQAILAMVPDYDVYVRHYTESIYETVMYFIPRGRR
jgi:FkbM family methyltransferase